jgi:lysophospholipase L1-like esterase
MAAVEFTPGVPMITKLIPLLWFTGLSIPLALAEGPAKPIQPGTPQAPVQIACIGDSITQGAGAAGGKSYPAQLQGLLGESWKVSNFGVSGRTLLKKGDFPYWKEKAYQKALASKPNVVIIMLGTNDTKPQNWKHEAEFVNDYRDLVKSFLALESKPQIFVCRPCPVPEPGNFGINDTNLKEVIKRVDGLAAEMNLGIIDMHAALVAKPQLLPDRVHPNTEGAGEMAKAAVAVLTAKPAPEPAAK